MNNYANHQTATTTQQATNNCYDDRLERFALLESSGQRKSFNKSLPLNPREHAYECKRALFLISGSIW